MKLRTILIIAVVALVLLGAAAAAVAVNRGGDRGTKVQIGTVELEDVVSTVLANGKLQPRNKVDISANIPGQIVNLAVREGDFVSRGDFLLQIDRVQYQASAKSSEANLQSLLHDVDASRASLEQAMYDLRRAETSFADELIPEQDLQRTRSAHETAKAALMAAEKRVEQARASLEGARDSLSKTTLRAPIDGLITALPVSEGEVAVIGTMNNPGTVLMTISDMSAIEAHLSVDETDVPRLAAGQPVELTVEAYPDETFDGVVREVGSSPITPGSDAATRTGSTTSEAIDFELKITVVNPPASVRPGFSVTAEVETGRAESVPVVPIQALVTRDADEDETDDPQFEEGVYVVGEDETATFVAVETGLTGSLGIQVLSGVGEGERIVVGPFRVLREIEDGDKVRPERDKQKEKDKKKEDSEA